ncbi:hypothetical protein CXG81DRAFT_24613 [Caulochytrium protostelioides]|uniref:RGS domain-containing protein n=1 Tax=Caulochytrium protostelioides TaxID=1555241 RepID=A0A4P9XBF6_9FUNG|nr:hypothetical protein CXG81DRAFT_24613 [Caulochytrium protostelioides]|eukprot:RKP02733.1 hypothetical protein CXG81DRAFT_24613 [Caulochytrium protostelioides]
MTAAWSSLLGGASGHHDAASSMTHLWRRENRDTTDRRSPWFWSPWLSEIYIIVLAVFSFFWIVSLGVFIIRRKHHAVSSCGVTLTVIGSLSGYLVCVAFLLNTIVYAWPCFATLWSINLFLTTWMACLIARAIRHASRYRPGVSAVVTPMTRDPGDFVTGTTMSRSTVSRGKHNDGADASIRQGQGQDQGQGPDSAHFRRYRGIELNRIPDSWKFMKPLKQLIRRTLHSIRMSDNYLIAWIVLMFLGEILVTIVIQIFSTNCRIRPVMDARFCHLSWEYIPVLLVLTPMLICACPLLYWIFRYIRSAHGVRKDLLISVLVGGPMVFLFIISCVWLEHVVAWQPWTPSNWLVISLISSQVSSVLMPTLRSFFQDWDRRRRIQPGVDAFLSVLEDPVLFAEFREVAVADLTIESTVFLYELRLLEELASTHYLWKATVQPLLRQPPPAMRKAPSRTLSRFVVLRDAPPMPSEPGPDPDAAEDAGPMARPARPAPPAMSACGSTTSAPAATDAGSQPLPDAVVSELRSGRLDGAASTLLSSSRPSSLSSGNGRRAVVPLDWEVPEKLRPRYIGIYRTFIERQAPMQIVLSAPLRHALQMAFSDPAARLTLDVFNDAKNEVLSRLYVTTYRTFLRHRQVQNTNHARTQRDEIARMAELWA